MKNEIEYIKSFNEFDYFDTVDLHIHSTCSDGKLTPEEIVKQAKAKGLKHIAICDHNTVKAHKILPKSDFVIKGIEFDCWYQGVLIHLLGYGVDVDNSELLKFCAKDKAGTTSDIVRFFSYRDPKKVIKAIHAAGGIAVLAHPACYWTISLDRFVKSLIAAGLDGIEVYYPYRRHRGIIKFHLAESVKKIAKKYNLIETGGSDTHGDRL
ncbi:MAG: PHP domain-containing protein [Candidatus Gastranaerophilales bacterium]|nr:PHP domain-containing protein [Candidatus Gastranaerophilales bacterium]